MACNSENPKGKISNQTLAQTGFEFTMDLYKQCVSITNGNFIFSPLNISVALGTILAGAKGNTAKEIKDVLKLGSSTTDNAIHEAFGEIINSLLKSQNPDIELNIANRIYLHNEASILSDYQSAFKKYYNTSAEIVDFEKEHEKITLKINQWIEDQTNMKIKNLVAPGILNNLARLVLVNAISFKGTWAMSFDSEKNYAGDFFLTENTAVMTEFMYEYSDFNYVYDENLQCRMVELPYTGNALSMFLILPTEVDGLEKLVKSLTFSNLNNLISRIHTREILLAIPKFTIESKLSLKKILSALGMNDAFVKSKADLNGIMGKKNLWVTSILHKASLEVSEEGSVSPLPTFLSIEIFMAESKILQFKAEHPFLFFIRDKNSGCILFWGRMINPNPNADVIKEKFTRQSSYADDFLSKSENKETNK